MRSRRLLPMLLLATAAWLAAGPGGVTLRAIAQCWHHPPAHGAHHGQQAELPPPPGTPCFCDEMTGGHDVLVTAAVPAPPVVSGVAAPALQEVPFPLPPSPFPGFTEAPTPPPPNPLA